VRTCFVRHSVGVSMHIVICPRMPFVVPWFVVWRRESISINEFRISVYDTVQNQQVRDQTDTDLSNNSIKSRDASRSDLVSMVEVH
jgi:hypothetical protein